MHDRKWRNEENENWSEIEDGFRSFSNLSGELKSFIDNFNGENLLEKSYNLFNKDAVVKGRLNSSNGELIVNDDENWVTSEFIPVEPGKRLQIEPVMGITVMYDSDYNYIGSISTASHPRILPNNARYIRNTMSQGAIENKYIYLGDNDLPYIDYGYSYSDKLISIIQAMINSQDDVPEYVNLFDKSKVVNGNISSSTGEVVDSGFLTSDFIKIRPNDTLIVLKNMGISAFYDNEKNFIKEAKGTAGEPFETPSNAAYFRTSMGKSSVDDKMVYHGRERMSYYPFNQGPGASEKDDSKPLKVLIIGNSYSVDTFTYLHDICVSAGVNVVVGVAHDSGGSLSDAMSKINNSQTIHSYYKWTNQNGYTRTASPLYDLAITDEDWDIILFQQMSFASRDYSTFQPHLSNLKSHVEGIATNPNVRFGINMIWERSTTSSSVGDKETQVGFYNDIVSNYRRAMLDSDLEILIPTGTAIQNGRENEHLIQVGYELTRDGAHLDEGIGRYIAAMTVFETLFNKNTFGDVSFAPGNADKHLVYLAKMVAKKAVDNPYKISEL